MRVTAHLARVFACGLLLASVVVFAFSASAAPAPTPHLPSLTPLAWVPNGPVNTVTQFGNRLVIGGSFTRISPRTGQATLVDATTGAPKTGFPEFAGGAVNTIVSDGAGGWFVGGFFQYVGGLSRTGLARVRADGSIDPRFNPSLLFVYNVSSANPDGQVELGGVTALALSGSTLYVGGTFDRAEGADREGLAAFDIGSGAITPWNPHPDASGNFIRSLAATANAVYVAGGFSQIGGAARTGLAALDLVTGKATSWNPAPDQTAAALALGAGAIYVGGSFTKIGGSARQYLAAFDLSSGALTGWTPSIGAPVTDVAVAADTVAVASQVRNGATRTSVVYNLTADGTARWHLDTDGAVAEVTFAGSDMLVSGAFHKIGGATRDGVARLDTNGKIAAWSPQPNLLANEFGEASSVDALAVASGGIVIGGDFVTFGGVARSGLAAIDPADGRPSIWHPALNGSITALVADTGHVYVAGRFSTVDHKARNGAAAFNERLALLPWNPPALAAGSADNLAVLPGKVVMTGYFNGVAPSKEFHGSIAAFDAGNGDLLAWGPSNLVGDGIGQLLTIGGRIYTTFNGGNTETVVLLDPKTGRMRRNLVHNNSTGDIRALALAGPTLYLGGAMEAVDFNYRTRFAAVDTTTWRLLPWKPVADDTVFSLIAQNGVVYAGGQFRHVNGEERKGLAALDPSSGALLDWNPKLNGNVRKLFAFSGGFAAIGSFLSANGRPEPYLALFST